MDQHFLGDDLLIAPVLEEGAEDRSVVLPPGLWHSLLGVGTWDGGASGATVTVAAPLGSTPVFGRGGTILPLGDPEVMTSYPGSAAGVVGVEDRMDRLHLVGFSGGSSELRLADGTELSFSAGEVDPSIVPHLDGTELASSCEEEESTDCVESVDQTAGSAVFRVTWGDDSRSIVGKGWTLTISAGLGRSGTFTLRFPESS